VPDVYATITEAEPALVEQIAEILEFRAADPQQRAMREGYLSEIEFPQCARVLEVGCGSGAVSRALAAWTRVGEVVGIDPSPILLAKARDLAGDLQALSFVEGDGRAMPFESASFDAVVFHTTLCHVPEPERGLAEAMRVLRSEGTLALFDGDYTTTTVSTGEFDPLQACTDAFVASSLQNRWLIRRLPRLVAAAGFELVRFASHGYVEAPSGGYTLSIIDRGAAVLVASGAIGAEAAESLKAEAHRRSDAGTFFGHIAYASLIAQKPG
jgi:ubiquinone/menaquinone biosynthesis C-methylase UbiE